MQDYLPYAAIIVAVIGFCFQFAVFVRPEQLERKHREILEDAEKKFVSMAVFQRLESQVSEMSKDVKEILRHILDQ